MCFILMGLVATVSIPSTDNPDTPIGKERYETRVHTINNVNPYQGMTATEGHGKYPVIFEPLQNVQTSCSTYNVTYFIDFAPYLEYFQQFERYLEAFKDSIGAFENDPVLQEFREETLRQLVARKGKHANIMPFVMHNLCFTDYVLRKHNKQLTDNRENVVWHDICKLAWCSNSLNIF